MSKVGFGQMLGLGVGFRVKGWVLGVGSKVEFGG